MCKTNKLPHSLLSREVEGLTEREKRVMRRDDVRAEQERQMGIDILLRQADEVIRSIRENEGSPEGARIEGTEIRERDLQFQRLRGEPNTTAISIVEEADRLSFAGRLDVSIRTQDQYLSELEDDVSKTSRRRPYQPHYPSSSESFMRELDKDVELLQHKTSTPVKDYPVVHKGVRERDKISYRDHVNLNQNEIAQSRAYDNASVGTYAKESPRVYRQQRENISELSKQADRTIQSLKSQLEEHDMFEEEKDVEERIQALLHEDRKLEEQRKGREREEDEL